MKKRSELKLTLQELSELSGVSHHTISVLEYNKRLISHESFLKVIKALKINVNEFSHDKFYSFILSGNWGAKIKNLRLNLSLTQEQFAKKMNLTPQAVIDWEHERCIPSIKSLSKIISLYEEIK